ncbi:MAG: hypothetical protein GC201_05785 [Alphaproteobacteria bacterium]|nr:hypothetical protein [Alphaproteobacteria bacterium]
MNNIHVGRAPVGALDRLNVWMARAVRNALAAEFQTCYNFHGMESMNRNLGRLLDDLSGVTADDAMRQLVSDYLSGLGFEGFMFNTYGDADVRMMCSCGQDLLVRYRRGDYHLVDPVSQTARNSWLPVSWDASRLRAECKGAQARLFEITLEHGYERGISSPIRGPAGRLDMFVALSRLNEGSFSRSVDVWKNEFMLIGAYMSSVYHNVLHPEEERSADLTPRELECLYWTAHGKTAWEVAQLLEVAERTVQFHIQNACRKLDSVSKHQATLKAAIMGLIQL